MTVADISTFEDQMDSDQNMSVLDPLDIIKHLDIEPGLFKEFLINSYCFGGKFS